MSFVSNSSNYSRIVNFYFDRFGNDITNLPKEAIDLKEKEALLPKEEADLKEKEALLPEKESEFIKAQELLQKNPRSWIRKEFEKLEKLKIRLRKCFFEEDLLKEEMEQEKYCLNIILQFPDGYDNDFQAYVEEMDSNVRDRVLKSEHLKDVPFKIREKSLERLEKVAHVLAPQVLMKLVTGHPKTCHFASFLREDTIEEWLRECCALNTSDLEAHFEQVVPHIPKELFPVIDAILKREQLESIPNDGYADEMDDQDELSFQEIWENVSSRFLEKSALTGTKRITDFYKYLMRLETPESNPDGWIKCEFDNLEIFKVTVQKISNSTKRDTTYNVSAYNFSETLRSFPKGEHHDASFTKYIQEMDIEILNLILLSEKSDTIPFERITKCVANLGMEKLFVIMNTPRGCKFASCLKEESIGKWLEHCGKLNKTYRKKHFEFVLPHIPKALLQLVEEAMKKMDHESPKEGADQGLLPTVKRMTVVVQKGFAEVEKVGQKRKQPEPDDSTDSNSSSGSQEKRAKNK